MIAPAPEIELQRERLNREVYALEFLGRIPIPTQRFVLSLDKTQPTTILKHTPSAEEGTTIYCRKGDVLDPSGFGDYTTGTIEFVDPPCSPFEHPWNQKRFTFMCADEPIFVVKNHHLKRGECVSYKFDLKVDGEKVDPVIIVGE
jgi:hypothetical protein